MNRARWYSTSITLINGETYIQGGSGGADRPEIRGLDGSFRLMSGINTSAIGDLVPAQLRRARRPGLRLRPRQRSDVPGRHDRQRHDHDARQLQHRVQRRLVLERRDVPARPHPADRRQLERRLHDRHHRHHARSSRRRRRCRAARAWVNATVLADGKVLATSGSAVSRRSDRLQQHRGDLGPRHRAVAPGRGRAEDAPVPLERVAAARRQRSRQRRRCHVADAHHRPEQEQPERRDLLPAVPVHQTSRPARAARPTVANVPTWLDIGKTFAVDVAANAASVSRVTLVKTGSTTHSFNMDQRFLDLTFNASGSHVAVQAPTRAGDAPPGLLPAVRVQRSRRAVGRQDRPHGHRDRPEPRHRPGAHEPGRADQHRRCRSSTSR